MTTASKLMVHLEHIVMPEGVPLNARQVRALCETADHAQRVAAADRARAKTPFLLPEEEGAAQAWINEKQEAQSR